MRTLLLASSATLALGAFGTASAQDEGYYVGGSLGGQWLSDSDNVGRLDQDFTIGGTALDGATLPAGTPVGWTTEFDSGWTGGVQLGRDYGAFRVEGELAFASNDVDTHSGVFAGDVELDGVDTTALIETPDADENGVEDDLGVLIGDLVADGQGDIKTTYLFLNGYYDFYTENSKFTPYIGAGLGVGFVDVDYSPSSVGIVDDDDTKFAYQVMAGVDAAVSDNMSVYGEASYRGTSDVKVDVDLIPATLDVENRGTLLEVGLRYKFGA